MFGIFSLCFWLIMEMNWGGPLELTWVVKRLLFYLLFILIVPNPSSVALLGWKGRFSTLLWINEFVQLISLRLLCTHRASRRWHYCFELNNAGVVQMFISLPKFISYSYKYNLNCFKHECMNSFSFRIKFTLDCHLISVWFTCRLPKLTFSSVLNAKIITSYMKYNISEM